MESASEKHLSNSVLLDEHANSEIAIVGLQRLKLLCLQSDLVCFQSESSSEQTVDPCSDKIETFPKIALSGSCPQGAFARPPNK